MQRGLSTIGLLPIAVIFSIYIKRGWLRMKVQPPTRWARRGQTQGLIKLYCMDSPTGFEVRQVKSTGSEVALKTDLHLTHQLEMIISRCITVSCSKGWYHGDLLCSGLLLYTPSFNRTPLLRRLREHTHTPVPPWELSCLWSRDFNSLNWTSRRQALHTIMSSRIYFTLLPDL